MLTSRIVCIVVALLVPECTGVLAFGASPTAAQLAQLNGATVMLVTEQRKLAPEPPRTFVPGPPIQPAAHLVEWLNRVKAVGSKQDRRVKLPVVFHLNKAHSEIIEAFIGVTDTADSETIFLSLNDFMMGVSLMDRLRQRCLSAYPTCVLWLEGYWGQWLRGGIPSPDEPGGPTKWPFTAVRVHNRIGAGTNGEEIRAQIESLEP